MVTLPWNRLIWGGLVGVFATLLVLPARVRDVTEGAGFNIGYLVFFIPVTVAMWQ